VLPPPRQKLEYEKVVVDEWLPGVIEDIEYDLQRKSMWKGQEKVGPAIRIKIVLEGYKFPKSSGWMSFVYADKSNLYKTYICGLVADPKPFMKFDPDLLKGMKIKGMWETNPKNPDYQNLVRIRPVGEKISAGEQPPADAPEPEEIPF
jgi:hypothetical protein